MSEPRMTDELLNTEDGSLRLSMYDNREPWMPEDYDAFAVHALFDDSSFGMIYVSALDRKSGLLELAARWERMAKALRELAVRR